MNEFANTIAKITVDSTLTKVSLSDIFLDVSMFNSYSFLQELSQTEKQDFNRLKVEYAKNNNLPSYLEVDYAEDIGCFSFALSCRNDNQEFDPVYILYLGLTIMMYPKSTKSLFVHSLPMNCEYLTSSSALRIIVRLFDDMLF